MAAEVRVLKAELAKARANAAAAVTLAEECEPFGLGGLLMDFVRVYSFVIFMLIATNGRRGEI
jgi:hypothetical protein